VTTRALLERLGGEITTEPGGVTRVRVARVTSHEAPYELVSTMRASVLVLGPLLARTGVARVALPGGCAIGVRPIDQHLKGFQKLGADIAIQSGYVEARASRLKGARITTDLVTVTGTENLMMAAVLAEGTTVIEGAASEPEVCDLANFLNKMGAKIEGAGTKRLIIEGVKELHGCEHDIIPDRIEAGTFLVAGAVCGKGVTVTRVEPKHVTAVTTALTDAGYRIEMGKNSVTVSPNGASKPLEIATQPYPGFPTDMQAQMCALLSTTEGISVVTENIFPQRYMHLAELKRMGAHVQIEGSTAVITGVEKLLGAPVMASDLRASAALVLAGLKADGVTEISRVYHIDRGYEHLDEKLGALGAHIERVKAD
jgi:UDP-N-acetylglucosamine 1-carboxyvinyltransferase